MTKVGVGVWENMTDDNDINVYFIYSSKLTELELGPTQPQLVSICQHAIISKQEDRWTLSVVYFY